VNSDHITTEKHATISVNSSPSPNLVETAQTIVEEMACAIAEAQAALFAGRFHDLEYCAGRLQNLCLVLKEYGGDPSNGSITQNHPLTLVNKAQRVRQQNKLFTAVLRRMHRHLGALRGLMNGPALTYQPKPAALQELRD
jgi:hypothetical protein